jgi:hypothetical protein
MAPRSRPPLPCDPAKVSSLNRQRAFSLGRGNAYSCPIFGSLAGATGSVQGGEIRPSDPRSERPSDYQEVAGSTATVDEIIAMEGLWKQKLQDPRDGSQQELSVRILLSTRCTPRLTTTCTNNDWASRTHRFERKLVIEDQLLTGSGKLSLRQSRQGVVTDFGRHICSLKNILRRGDHIV